MLSHRLAALVLSLGLLSGLWAAAEPAERITEHVRWMENEITNLWSIYLKEQGFTLGEARKVQLETLAHDLARATEKYQRVPSNWKWWRPTRVGTPLPKKADAHLVLATIAAMESKVDPQAVGKLGEVGILQCHKWCRERYSPQEIKNNPQLGIELGVRFLAKSIDQCGIRLDSMVSKERQDEAWSKPVSVYGAGNNAIENSRCIAKQFARWRVSEMKRFRTKIRGTPGGGDDGKVCGGTTAPKTAESVRTNPV